MIDDMPIAELAMQLQRSAKNSPALAAGAVVRKSCEGLSPVGSSSPHIREFRKLCQNFELNYLNALVLFPLYYRNTPGINMNCITMRNNTNWTITIFSNNMCIDFEYNCVPGNTVMSAGRDITNTIHNY